MTDKNRDNNKDPLRLLFKRPDYNDEWLAARFKKINRSIDEQIIRRSIEWRAARGLPPPTEEEVRAAVHPINETPDEP
mgnify:CR=1 FL=1